MRDKFVSLTRAYLAEVLIKQLNIYYIVMLSKWIKRAGHFFNIKVLFCIFDLNKPRYLNNSPIVKITTTILCPLNFIHVWRHLQFKVDSNDRFLRIFLWQFYFSQSFCQKSAEMKSLKKYFHIFVLKSDVGFELGPYV